MELFAAMKEVKEEAAKFMKVRALWQFFEAEAEGEKLHLFSPVDNVAADTWKLKRQFQCRMRNAIMLRFLW